MGVLGRFEERVGGGAGCFLGAHRGKFRGYQAHGAGDAGAGRSVERIVIDLARFIPGAALGGSSTGRRS